MNPPPTPRIPPPVPTPEDIPSDLAASLRALHPHAPTPAHIDAAILTHARRTANRRTWQRRVLIAAPLAAAAGLALAVWVVAPIRGRGSNNPASPEFATRSSERLSSEPGTAARATFADPSHDGVLDMRDALALAHRIQRSTPQPGDDQNNDGVVDTRDVDALALLAVNLGPAKGGGA